MLLAPISVTKNSTSNPAFLLVNKFPHFAMNWWISHAKQNNNVVIVDKYWWGLLKKGAQKKQNRPTRVFHDNTYQIVYHLIERINTNILVSSSCNFTWK